MATLSVPLPPHLEEFIASMVKRGRASTKAEVVRQALSSYVEEETVQAVLRAEQELKDGKEMRGNLRTLLQKKR